MTKISKTQRTGGPSKGKLGVLQQICNLIPPHLVAKLARETGVESKARTYSPWSHVVTLLYAQLVHAIGLNDVCDSLRLHCGLLIGIRGATPSAGLLSPDIEGGEKQIAHNTQRVSRLDSSFLSWMEKHERIAKNSLKHVQKVQTNGKQVRSRRPFTNDEMRRQAQPSRDDGK